MENIQGYEIEKSVLFENSRGFALGHNPAAPQPYVTWQFTENVGGVRDYYWGHYHTDNMIDGVPNNTPLPPEPPELDKKPLDKVKEPKERRKGRELER